MAAEQGHSSAQHNLAIMYFTGEGVTMNAVAGYMWTEIAIAGGYAPARRLRDIASNNLTLSEIAEARVLAIEWIEEHQPSD